MKIPITPLDPWIAGRLINEFPRYVVAEKQARIEDRSEIERAQKHLLSRTIEDASLYSPFYHDRLGPVRGVPFNELPFTFPSDLAESGLRFLTVSQSEIRRIVTLSTSGTSAPPKRVFFTEEDLKATEDFFMCGMTTFTPPESIVLVFMEGPSPDSIGQILKRALQRLGCETLVFGLIRDPRDAIRAIDDYHPNVVVGLSAQMARIAGKTEHKPHYVLLSADMAPVSIRQRIEKLWGCTTFNHYGLTETGWGCAVECRARQGCHIRELDLYVEIVDENGQVLPDGKCGEMVITTLSRRSFPLIRYRTGDEGRILQDVCPCGSPLKRIEVLGRLPRKGAGGVPLRLYDVEDALWRLPWIEDFKVSLQNTGDIPEKLSLTIAVAEGKQEYVDKAVEVLRQVPGVPRNIIVKKVSPSSIRHQSPKMDWED